TARPAPPTPPCPSPTPFRSRRKVQGGAARDDEDDAARRQAVVSAFMAASRDGDFAGLLALLHPEAVLRVDEAAVKMGSIPAVQRSEEHTSELQSPDQLVCRL